MALVLADRVQETTTSVGTGAVTLAGAVLGYQSFSVIGNGNTTFYTIAAQGGADWEVGIGTYTSSGTSLSRDTVLASSNSGSLVTFGAGIKAVFVTYPSEKSVNLNASGNVSALGTVSSGTWQGTTVGVAYGGTGVTASSGANSVVLRDANGNITGVNNVQVGLTAITSAGGTTTLTATSTQVQILVGSANQTIKLPDATTLAVGFFYTISNASSGVLTVQDNAGTVIETIEQGGAAQALCTSISTSAGSWGFRVFAASNVTWGNANLDFNGTITSATWQGDTVASGYGGTGLTTFTAANYALYSTSSSALTAGTLPVAAGGTGVTTSSGANSVVIRDANASVSGSQLIASNGIVVNSNTVSASYSIPSGSSATSAGPMTVASGVTVTVPSGSRWVVL